MSLRGVAQAPLLAQAPVAVEDAPPVAGPSSWFDVQRDNALWGDTARTAPAGVNSTVASWYDPGNDRVMTRGVIAQQGVNTGNALLLDGVDDAYTIEPPLGAAADEDWTLFVIARQVEALDRFYLGSNIVNNQYRANYESAYLVYDGGHGAQLITSGAQPVSAWTTLAVHAVRRVGTEYTFFRDGIEVGSYTATQSRVLTFDQLGQLYSGSTFNGEYRMVLSYQEGLSDQQVYDTSVWGAERHDVILRPPVLDEFLFLDGKAPTTLTSDTGGSLPASLHAPVAGWSDPVTGRGAAQSGDSNVRPLRTEKGLWFDGLNDWIITTSKPASPLVNGLTWFVVADPREFRYALVLGAGAWPHIGFGVGSVMSAGGEGPENQAVISPPGDTPRQLLAMRITPGWGALTGWVGDFQQTIDLSSMSFAGLENYFPAGWAPLAIGTRVINDPIGPYYEGHIASVLLYERDLSDDEVARNLAWLSRRYLSTPFVDPV